jgi:hypothetical protein
MKTHANLYIISRLVLLRMRNGSDRSCTENQNTYFMFNIPPPPCIAWDNLETYGRLRQAIDNNAIRHMHFACWMSKATDTLRIYNNYCFSTAKHFGTNAPPGYVILTLPVIFSYAYVVCSRHHCNYTFTLGHACNFSRFSSHEFSKFSNCLNR